VLFDLQARAPLHFRLPVWSGITNIQGVRLFGFIAAILFTSVTYAGSEASPLYIYTLPQNGTAAAYDQAMAVASLQGVINRASPELYILSTAYMRPRYWLDVLSRNGRWLQDRKRAPLPDLGALVKLAGPRLKGAVIWDPAVPATINVATTCAGVRDAVVLSPELADRYLAAWRLPVLEDFRGRFTGTETGSRKNDAYRWAIREYLAKGLCSPHRLCLYEDSFSTRARGDSAYVVTRDWAVKNRAFVFDLSPWGDEAPGDDPSQRLGLDLESYKMILAETLRQSAGKQMTEMTGFFALSKYSDMPDHHSIHQGVPTEWESVGLITPYNCYQNTITSDCFNESLHSQAARHPLHQRSAARPVTLGQKAYICILMADYDSATPLYDFLPKFWADPNRGKLPLAWGIDPSQLETYPDLIAYFYQTASPADTFTADASAAGYMNPNRVEREYLPLFVQHNQTFFREADMTIAPMVLDQDQPSPTVKDAFQQFAPDGFGTIIATVQQTRGAYPAPQVWKGMPIIELLNDTCNSKSSGEIADTVANVIRWRGHAHPGFYFFRAVWVSPTVALDAANLLRRRHPELNGEIVGPREFFALYKESLTKH
jgi:hypothetical protein